MNSISIITAKSEPYQIEYHTINSMHPGGINDSAYEELINASSAFFLRHTGFHKRIEDRS